MMTVLSWLPPVLAAVLLSAALLKAAGLRRGDLDWPRLELPVVGVVPPAAVVVGEALLAVGAMAIGRPSVAAVPLAVAFAGLAVTASILSGRVCACFGAAAARVGPWHVLLNVVAATTMVVVLIVAPPVVPATGRTAVTVVLTITVVAVAEWRRRVRRRTTQPDDGAGPLPAAATTIVVVVSAGCGACARLRARLQDYPESWLHWRQAAPTPDDEWAQLAGHRFPCAVPVGADGSHVDRPRWGVPAIVDLADQLADRRITAGGPER